ncbi:MAG: NAD(P)/FAD-dependent oxidoreductase [Caulobacteraceae bacterium]
MADTATLERPSAQAGVEHFDVLIVGAGISGVGGAYHLTQERPQTSFVVLEAMESFGGTWWTHTYPGARSDSDLYTFGYRFKPWIGAPIASRAEILKYMGEVIDENDLAKHIRYGHRITKAAFSSQTNLWSVEATELATGQVKRFTCGFLWMCHGYFRQGEGYTPEWPGMSDYKGRIVHPASWPKDVDYKGKKVLIIGSGATAATLGPAIAAEASHTTILQRTPTYFLPGINQNELANQLRDLKVPEEWVHEIIRRQVVQQSDAFTKRCFEDPETVKKELVGMAKMFLDAETVDKHFTPPYLPWRQRVAFIPGGDLFVGINQGKVGIVTDEIETFNASGVMTKGGVQIDADLVITATGFNLCSSGDIEFTVDGETRTLADSVTWRGMMFTGFPNFLWVFGYFRASWTLRTELVTDFLIRMLKHMDEKGAKRVEVALRPEDHNMELGPWIDPENFNPGYVTRSQHLLPKAGPKVEWRHSQDYLTERDALPAVDLDGAEFKYS